MFSTTSGSRRGGRAAGAAIMPLLILGLAACGGAGDSTPEAAEPPAAEEPSPAPQVFFAAPAEGSTVQAPVRMEFGAEHFTIEPVGDGDIHAGAGHMHIGIDTECLPAGTVIPTASPWVHFGDGSMQIDVDLTPGEHTIVLQIGDGEHRTIDEPGLCNSVTFNVE